MGEGGLRGRGSEVGGQQNGGAQQAKQPDFPGRTPCGVFGHEDEPAGGIDKEDADGALVEGEGEFHQPGDGAVQTHQTEAEEQRGPAVEDGEED